MKVKFQVEQIEPKPDKITADVEWIVEGRHKSNNVWQFRGAFSDRAYAGLYIKSLENEYGLIGMIYRARRTID